MYSGIERINLRLRPTYGDEEEDKVPDWPIVYISDRGGALLHALAERPIPTSLCEASDPDFALALQGRGLPFICIGAFGMPPYEGADTPQARTAYDYGCQHVQRLNTKVRLECRASALFVPIDGPDYSEAADDIALIHHRQCSSFRPKMPIGLAYGPNVTMSIRAKLRGTERLAHFTYDDGDLILAFTRFLREYWGWVSKARRRGADTKADPVEVGVYH